MIVNGPFGTADHSSSVVRNSGGLSDPDIVVVGDKSSITRLGSETPPVPIVEVWSVVREAALLGPIAAALLYLRRRAC